MITKIFLLILIMVTKIGGATYKNEKKKLQLYPIDENHFSTPVFENYTIMNNKNKITEGEINKIESKIIELIKEETKSIKICAKKLTNPRIAKALFEAYKKDIELDLLIDKEALTSSFAMYELFMWFQLNGINYIITSKPIKDNVIIFDDNKKYKSALLLTGSYNLSSTSINSLSDELDISSSQELIDQSLEKMIDYKKTLAQKPLLQDTFCPFCHETSLSKEPDSNLIYCNNNVICNFTQNEIKKNDLPPF